MIHGRLNAATGELTEMSHRAPGTFADDVQLAAIPPGFGPFAYDAPTKTAIALPKASQTDAQKLGVDILPLLVAALAVKMDANYSTRTPAFKAKVEAIITSAADRVVAALT